MFGTGVLGGVPATQDVEPNHLAAWAKGADGERRLAAHLDRALSDNSIVLHDRQVPGTRGNIDHLVVARSGVWIVDAKNYAGQVERRSVGTRREPDVRLYVNKRNQTTLVRKMGWQLDAVRAVLDSIGFGAAPIVGCLCFTNAEWPLFARPFRIDDIWIGWGQALTKSIVDKAHLAPDAIATLAQHLSSQLPAS